MVDYSELTAKEARQSGESEGIDKVFIFTIMSVVDPYKKGTSGKRRILRYKLYPFKNTYITFRRQQGKSIKSMAIGIRHVARSEHNKIYKMPLTVKGLKMETQKLQRKV